MESQSFSSKPDNPNGPWDVVIVGSGPAGLTAAIYTTRGAASTLILGGTSWGGQLMLTTMVDNFPGFPKGILGPTLMEQMKEQAVRFGAEFLARDVASIEVDKNPFEIKTSDGVYLAKSIIVATGAEIKWLDAPGLKELIGRGISSCAPCDAPFFKDKKVAVVGGGDSAMEEALTLTKYASEVTIIHRHDTFKASAAMQAEVKKNPKIKIIWNSEVIEVKGKDKLESVGIKNNQTGQVTDFPLDGLFIAIGHRPSSMPFQGKIELDEKGYVLAKEGRTQTSVPGVFVSGDVQDITYKQAITAAGFGCMAAMDTLKYLSEEEKSK